MHWPMHFGGGGVVSGLSPREGVRVILKKTRAWWLERQGLRASLVVHC